VSVLAVTTFLAILALGAVAAVVLTAVLAGMDRTRLLPGTLDGARAVIGPAALWLAVLVAAVSTAGSLYLSEVAGFVPCALCWYQRIAMYPLVVILGVAAVRGDASVRRYAVPVAVIGALISVWHIGVERIPGMPSGACSLDVPCSLIYVERFGFVTIPVMALAGFVAIITLLLVYAGRGTTTPTETLP
jgi:disulfide bond formation protein DsbB